MSFQRDADEILTDFREVEHDLQRVPRDSAEAQRLRDEIERLRAEHQSLTRAAEETGLSAALPIGCRLTTASAERRV